MQNREASTALPTHTFRNFILLPSEIYTDVNTVNNVCSGPYSKKFDTIISIFIIIINNDTVFYYFQ